MNASSENSVRSSSVHSPAAPGGSRQSVTTRARSTKISEHGPHGPVSAICQKLSLSPRP